MKSKALQSTAYHEAGHAVAAHWRKYPFKLVTIIPDKTAGSLGHVSLKTLRSFDAIERDITPKLSERIADSIVISFAGGIAQKKFHKRGYRRFHTSSDNQHAAELALRINGASEAANTYLRWLYIVARDLVDGHWKDIRAVAIELLRRKTISRDDVDRAIYLANGHTEAEWLSWSETCKTMKRAAVHRRPS